MDYKTKCDYQLENLSEIFCADINKLKEDAFEQDIVITQSASMESYLNRCIATNNNISINVRYMQPRNFISEMFKLCGLNIDEQRFSKKTMLWQILKLLPELEKNAIYAPLKNYVEEDMTQIDYRRYQLAKVIADLFDNYVAYRGEWLEKWQQKEFMFSNQKHELWQADLWRKLTDDYTEPFLRAMPLIAKHIEQYKNKLPKEIYIFGISNLPKDFIEFFQELGKYIEINFYYLGPCFEYWADINKKSATIDKLDNKLLASWGALGRDFLTLLLENNFAIGGDELNKNIPTDTLLGAIQNDILYNISESSSNLREQKIDNSIIINNCFSKMREVEILYDQILDLLSKDIKPSEIVIMATNIEEYSPYINAIFDNPEQKNFKIPYSIADCSVQLTSKTIDVFMKILNIANSKMLAQDIFDIISSEPIANKFKLSIDDLSEISKLIINSNIIWGKDCIHRKNILNQEYNNINSWEFGFERLFAGYAFDTESIVDNGVLPLGLEKKQASVLGKFKTICDKIFAYSNELEINKNIDDWYDCLLTIVNDLFEIDNEQNDELKAIYKAIYLLNKNLKNAQFADVLSLEIIKNALSDEFSEDGNKSGLFGNGLTFCRLLPMRNIPFKSICILGLNEGIFPRLDKKCGFDLMQIKSQLGDRSMRKDDRYIFLETMMACREKLYLSYIGQNIKDNEEIPPSILISELVDYICDITKSDSKHFIIKHPLQPFHKQYFDNKSQLFSYSNINCDAAKSLTNNKDFSKEYFCDKKLKINNNLKFSFDDFVNFFISPTKFFLKNMLNINLYKENIDSIKSCENFSIDNLEKWILNDDFIQDKILNKNSNLKTIKKAVGNIPFGAWGDKILNTIETDTQLLSEKIKSFGGKSKPKTWTIKEEYNGITINLKGEFNNIYGDNQLFYRPTSIKIKDKLKAWIWHQLALKAELNYQTYIFGIDKNELQELNIYLEKSHIDLLLQIFIKGLQEPLPLFLESSVEYAKILKGKDELQEKALTAAMKKWEKGYDDYGYDLKDEANRICFGSETPILDERYKENFIELANNIYGNINKEVRN